ncbi:MAG: hypothetical protein ABIJ43_05015 [Candidatus Beckwithbacteria bacterium]|nr:hypothetical protein [Patescibacteria group bacterium]
MKKYLSLTLIIFSFFFLTGFAKPNQESIVITGPIFKIGKSIIFNDSVDGDVFLLGGEVSVDATISGDLIVIAGLADINGYIHDDLRIAAGQINLKALVDDNTTLLAGQTRLTSDAQLNGDLYIHSAESSLIDNKAIINGRLLQTRIDKNNPNLEVFKKIKTPTIKKLTAFIFLQQLTILAIEILIGSLLIIVFPKLAKKLLKITQQEPGLALGWGFLSLIAIPLFGVLLLITLIGIPIGVLLFIIFGFSIYIAKLIIALSIGSKVLKDKNLSTPYKNLALGLIILACLKLLPVIGWLAYFILILNGLGAIALLEKDAIKRLKK